MSRNPQANDGVTFNTLETLEETASVNDKSLTISTFATQGQQCGGGGGNWSGHGHGRGNSTPTRNANTGRGPNSQARNTDLSHVQCFQCHQFGHYASNCPVPYDEIVQMPADPASTEQSGGLDDESDHVQFGIMATTNLSVKSTVPKTWILLNNASTVDVFSNPSANHMLRILCAARTAYTNYITDFPKYRTIWFLHDGFANILSLQQMKKCYWVTYDSGGISPDCFVVHKSDTVKCYFHESKEGLFYLDSQVDLNTGAFVTTVEDMESLYSNRDVRNAKAARKLQHIISQPNSQYFQHLIQNNLLPGCNLTANDGKITDHIYGHDLGSIKGKTV